MNSHLNEVMGLLNRAYKKNKKVKKIELLHGSNYTYIKVTVKDRVDIPFVPKSVDDVKVIVGFLK